MIFFHFLHFSYVHTFPLNLKFKFLIFLPRIDQSACLNKTSHRPVQCAGKFDMIIFYWIIIELIY